MKTAVLFISATGKGAPAASYKMVDIVDQLWYYENKLDYNVEQKEG